MNRDPWEIVAKPIFWLVMAVLTLKQAARLNWEKRAPKYTSGTGRWNR